MTDTYQRDQLYITAISASVAAGKVISGIYHDSYSIEYKSDNSPLTLADKEAHNCIAGYLETTNLPVLSEEGKAIPYEVRKRWHEFWMVDPLDGTKEFINKNGEFTVNIALIRDGLPVMGVVFVPVSGILYFGSENNGSYRIDTHALDLSMYTLSDTQDSIGFSALHELLLHAEKLPLPAQNRNVSIVGSRSHQNAGNDEVIRSFSSHFEKVNIINVGSSLKFCKMAEGTADFYPRLGPTMEWDTAAGHAVCKFAGIKVLKHTLSEELTYNKPNLLNPHFIVVNSKFEEYL